MARNVFSDARAQEAITPYAHEATDGEGVYLGTFKYDNCIVPERIYEEIMERRDWNYIAMINWGEYGVVYMFVELDFNYKVQYCEYVVYTYELESYNTEKHCNDIAL